MTATGGKVAGGSETSRKRHPLPRAGRIVGSREETSLLAFFSILLIHRRLIAICALAGMSIAGVRAAAEANLYLSRASFVVKGARATAQLPGGASGLGISLMAAADFSQSIVFYSDLVRAKAILVPVAAKSYATENSRGVKRPLAEVLGIEAKSPRAGAIMAADKLFSTVSSSIYSRSGVVGLAVEATDPLLAQQIAANVLEELDQYSRTRRHAQAAQEREFIEGLVGEARARLSQSEQNASNFLVQNRDYQGAPQLTMQYDRIQRDVAMQQQVYTSLTQALEQAKIEEVRDPSAISVVEAADLPADPQRTTAVRKTLLGLAVGLFVGIALAFVVHRAEEQQQGQSEAFRRFITAVRSRKA